MHEYLITTTALLTLSACSAAPTDKMGLSNLTKLGEVEERYQAYNIEMVEVTGGRFWAPYGGPADERYRQRPPINLTNPKLIVLAKNLGPSLMGDRSNWLSHIFIAA